MEPIQAKNPVPIDFLFVFLGLYPGGEPLGPLGVVVPGWSQ